MAQSTLTDGVALVDGTALTDGVAPMQRRSPTRYMCERCAEPVYVCDCGAQVRFLRTVMANGKAADGTPNSVFAQWLMAQWSGDTYFLSQSVVWRHFQMLYSDGPEAFCLEVEGECELDDAVRRIDLDQLDYEEVIKYIQVPPHALEEVRAILADD